MHLYLLLKKNPLRQTESENKLHAIVTAKDTLPSISLIKKESCSKKLTILNNNNNNRIKTKQLTSTFAKSSLLDRHSENNNIKRTNTHKKQHKNQHGYRFDENIFFWYGNGGCKGKGAGGGMRYMVVPSGFSTAMRREHVNVYINMSVVRHIALCQ